MKNRITMLLLLVLILVPAVSWAGTVQLPVTGQTGCWDTVGNAISCFGTGQDGEKRAGVAWPEPRFTDNDDQTMTDKLTGLIWAKNANTPGPAACGPNTQKEWQEALDYVACLNNNTYLNHSDWRLPNRNELKSLVNFQQPNSSTWLNNQGFSNVQSEWYWSSSTWTEYSTAAWVVFMNKSSSGAVIGDTKSGRILYVWPVCGEQSTGTVQLPKTGQTAIYSTGDDGDLQKGADWPTPRFNDNGNGTVTDNLTGLLWLQNAKCTDTSGGIGKPNGVLTWADALTWSNSLASGACGLTDGSVAGDWRLPNIKELESLIDLSKYDLPLPAGHPFNNVQEAYYWSSTTKPADASSAMHMEMKNVWVGSTSKSASSQVWAVRGGQRGVSLVINKSDRFGDVEADKGEIYWSDIRTGTAAYFFGATVILTATAWPSGTFAGWSGACTNKTGPCVLTMDEDKNVTANFTYNTYTITSSAGANGSISPTVTAGYGTYHTFTITPADNYHVAKVLVDGVSVGAVTSYTFSSLKANHTIAATFAINTYEITIWGYTAAKGVIGLKSCNGLCYNSSSGWTLLATGEKRYEAIYDVDHGANPTFSITPAANHHVADVKVDYISVGALTSYTFSNVTAQHKIVATFAINTYTITSSAGANGSISPMATVDHGASSTIAITPAANYHVADVLVDGTSVGAVASYTFNNVTTNHTIAATFAPNESEATLYGSFTNAGIWQWTGSGWTQLTPDNPESIVAAGTNLYGKFANGIWQWTGSGWTHLTPDRPAEMVAAGSNLYGNFTGNGIWKWGGSGWTQLTPDNPETMVASGSNLYGKFANGIWQWTGSGWNKLTPDRPAEMVAAGSNLYGNFTGNGIWQWNGNTWNQLTPDNPEAMVASGTNLYVDFGNSGLWKWNGTGWNHLTPDNPSRLAASSTSLYGSFSNSGIWEWNGSGWTLLTPDTPALMAVGE